MMWDMRIVEYSRSLNMDTLVYQKCILISKMSLFGGEFIQTSC